MLPVVAEGALVSQRRSLGGSRRMDIASTGPASGTADHGQGALSARVSEQFAMSVSFPVPYPRNSTVECLQAEAGRAALNRFQ